MDTTNSNGRVETGASVNLYRIGTPTRAQYSVFDAHCAAEAVTDAAGVGYKNWIRISKELLKVYTYWVSDVTVFH